MGNTMSDELQVPCNFPGNIKNWLKTRPTYENHFYYRLSSLLYLTFVDIFCGYSKRGGLHYLWKSIVSREK